MKGLVLDTTLKKSYVAAFDGEKEVVCYFDGALSTQSSLIPTCQKALSALSIAPADLDGIAAVVGPGSFTGIRIGVTFANAVCFALSLPRFALTSFDVMSSVCPNAACFAIDAGHDSSYAAVLDGGALTQKNIDNKDLPEGTVFQETILDKLPAGALLAARKAFEEKAFSACAPTKETTYLKPNYMRKSQAERMKDLKA